MNVTSDRSTISESGGIRRQLLKAGVDLPALRDIEPAVEQDVGNPIVRLGNVYVHPRTARRLRID